MSIEENRNCGCGYQNNDNQNVMIVNTHNNSCGCETERTVDCDARREMLQEIRCLDFAINELALYLDTHPNAKAALDLRNFYLKQYNNAMNRYQKQFGALGMNDENLNETPFQWVQSPWPWEGK